MKSLWLIVSVALMLCCSAHEKKGGDTSNFYYYSIKSLKNSVPDYYLVQKSEIIGNERIDTFYNYIYENNRYKYAFCYQQYFTLLNDSLLITNTDRGKLEYKTKFKVNSCDTTIIANDQFSSEEINCYLGKKSVFLNGKKVRVHHISTTKREGHSFSSMESYYDKAMYKISEKGNAPFGLGKYVLQRVNKIPFALDENEICR